MIRWLLRVLHREYHQITRPFPFGILLERWTLIGRRFAGGGKMFLHCFHRSDPDTPHDHPWSYWSLLIWPGYWEVTRYWDEDSALYSTVRRWYWPGSLLRRPADWVHRVELNDSRRSWSIVWTGPKCRSWGFICPDGFVHHNQAQQRIDHGEAICPGGVP